MGTQFTADGYAAVLTVDWSTVSAGDLPETDHTGAETDPSGRETTSDSADAEVETKDGLNIYPADADEKSTEAAQTEAVGTYIAHFKEPLLITVGVAAGVMILVGAVLVVSGRKEKK